MKKKAIKRNKTAKEIAQKSGEFCERTVRRYMAEDRVDYEERAKNRREQAFNLKITEDKSWEEVALIMNTTIDSVKGLVKRFRQSQRKITK